MLNHYILHKYSVGIDIIHVYLTFRVPCSFKLLTLFVLVTTLLNVNPMRVIIDLVLYLMRCKGVIGPPVI
jgi:hypothetical protein